MPRKFFLLTLFLSFLFSGDLSAQKTKKKTTSSKPKVQQVFTITPPPDRISNTSVQVDETIPANLTTLQKRRYETFDKVWNTINKYYFDPNFGGLNWKAMHSEFRPKIKNIKSDYDLHLMLQEMINRFNRSHLFMVLPEAFEEVEQAKAESTSQSRK